MADTAVQVLIDFEPEDGSNPGNGGGEVAVDADGKTSGDVELPSSRPGTNTFTIQATAADGTPVAGDIVITNE